MKFLIILIALVCSLPCSSKVKQEKGAVLTGQVSDTQGNPIAGVYVSDGFTWSQTDARGKYRIVSPYPDRVHFVSARIPADYSPILKDGVPVFFTKVSAYCGKRRQADITLVKDAGKGDAFTMFFIADPQFKTYSPSIASENVAYAGSDVFDNLVSEMRRDLPNFPGPCYGMCLGDIAQNNPEIYTHYCKGLATLGIPFFNVIGNHDHFHKKAETDEESALPYEAVFGPRNYSFDAGQVHFVILDNCIYVKGLRLYPMVYGLEDEFLAWLKEDLALVPKDMPVMVCIHANVFSETGIQEWIKDNINCSYKPDEFLAALQGFDKLYVWSGHSHVGNFIGPVRSVANSSGVEAFVLARSTGSMPGNEWLAGDGTPQGYVVMEVDGKDITWKFHPVLKFEAPFKGKTEPELVCKVTDREEPYQFLASSRGVYDNDFIYANVFLWDPMWEMPVLKVGDQSYPMVKDYGYDIGNKELYRFYTSVGNKWASYTTKKDNKNHHFRVRVPDGVSGKGIVSVTDRFGRTWTQEVSVDPIHYTDGLMHLAFDFRNRPEGCPDTLENNVVFSCTEGGQRYSFTLSSGRYVEKPGDEGHILLSGTGSTLALPAIPGKKLVGVTVHASDNLMSTCSAQITDSSGSIVPGGAKLVLWGECADSWTLENTKGNTSYYLSSTGDLFRLGNIRLTYSDF